MEEWIQSLSKNSYMKVKWDRDELWKANLQLGEEIQSLASQNQRLEGYAEQRHRAQEVAMVERERRKEVGKLY